jgi:hypothetical protein
MEKLKPVLIHMHVDHLARFKKLAAQLDVPNARLYRRAFAEYLANHGALNSKKRVAAA